MALVFSLANSVKADDETLPDNLTAIRQELARLGLQASCNSSNATCIFTDEGLEGSRALDVTVRYGSATQTVYIFIDRFLVLEDPAGPSLQLSRRLLELNRSMVTSKLEWDRTTNAIRISVVLNTDSNFDRKAFRSQIKGLLANARKLLPSLTVLLQTKS